LDRAIFWIDDQPAIDETLRSAIKARLEFRLKFLLGLQQDINIIQTRSVDHFEACLSLLPSMQQSSRAGQPVSEAFSWKIQRRLASTVPPRPMVTISLVDALAHLKRLFHDGIHLSQVLDYQGPHNLRV
jgi:hypothetical protein